MRLRIGYPDAASEREIIRNERVGAGASSTAVLSPAELVDLQRTVEGVRVEEELVGYLLAIVDQTRRHDSLALGVSPRGAQALYRAAQALALVEGRDYVLPDDIKRLAVPVFAHRIAVNSRLPLASRAVETGERIIEEILNRVEVPL
jgi:MoxR-like ATPase